MRRGQRHGERADLIQRHCVRTRGERGRGRGGGGLPLQHLIRAATLGAVWAVVGVRGFEHGRAVVGDYFTRGQEVGGCCDVDAHVVVPEPAAAAVAPAPAPAAAAAVARGSFLGNGRLQQLVRCPLRRRVARGMLG